MTQTVRAERKEEKEMNVKELCEALAAYPDNMEVEILSVFAPNMTEIQKDYYVIDRVDLNESDSCVTLLESVVSNKTEVIKL